MKISVAVITYNQQDTIAQTLDSILCQQGDFELEVLIGEDCSTDNTWAMCHEYAEHYPEQVVLLENTHNLGIMANFARVMKACTGEFVGICAGDDYWCDEHKLQKQLDFFMDHPECGVCTTGGYRYLVRRDEMVDGIEPWCPVEDGDVRPFYFNSNHKEGIYAAPLTMLFRRELLQYLDFDTFVERGFPVEDYPMQAIMAQHTLWGHIADKTVVYRVYSESASFISYDHPKYMAYHSGLVAIRQYLEELYPGQTGYTQEWADEYLFYREFLQYIHNGNFCKAKQLVMACQLQTPQVTKARRLSANRLIFCIFRMYKVWKNKRIIHKQT